MLERIERTRQARSLDGNRVFTEREVSTDDTDATLSQAAQIVWLIAGIINSLLAIRFILSLVGANTTNMFANLIYTLSFPFVAPFRGLLQVGTVEYGVSRVEVETIVAIVIYTLLAWLIARLITVGRRSY